MRIESVIQDAATHHQLFIIYFKTNCVMFHGACHREAVAAGSEVCKRLEQQEHLIRQPFGRLWPDCRTAPELRDLHLAER